MRKLVNFLILLPLAVVLIFLSVANRQPVQFSVDPMDASQSGLYVTLPFFVYLFGAFLVGLLIGGIVTWFTQGRIRRQLRETRSEVHKLSRKVEEAEKSTSEKPVEIAPGLPAISGGRG